MNPELVAILNIAAFQSALVCELGFTACWCSGRVLVEESESPSMTWVRQQWRFGRTWQN